MSFLFLSRANPRSGGERDPYPNHAASVPVGLPRCARNVFSRLVAHCVLLLLTVSCAQAATTISGTVTNGTTSKPAAGAEVILLKLSEGMQEQSRTRTDARGRFELKVDAATVPHLVRVVHQNVNYHRPAPPGTSSMEVQVYDSATQLEGISADVDLMRVQAQDGSLQVTEMFALKNESKPQRTLMGERTFVINLPEAARIDSSLVAGPGNMPVTSAPVPMGKGQYGFIYPLRPGETRFQISYSMPYSGEAEFSPRVTYKVNDFAVMLPKSMEFTASAPGTYRLADDQGGVFVQMAKNVGPGAVPGFRVKGTGTMPEEAESGPQASATVPENRPGGGIGRPSELPDPLRNYRWYIIGGVAAVLALGAFWFVSRQQQTAGVPLQNFAAPRPPQASAAGGSSMLLEALKEELFQLETERLQKKISQEEYERTKAALDQTLQRALARKAGS